MTKSSQGSPGDRSVDGQVESRRCERPWALTVAESESLGSACRCLVWMVGRMVRLPNSVKARGRCRVLFEVKVGGR